MKTFKIYYETTVAAKDVVEAIKAFEKQIKEDIKNGDKFYSESVLRGIVQVTSSSPTR